MGQTWKSIGSEKESSIASYDAPVKIIEESSFYVNIQSCLYEPSAFCHMPGLTHEAVVASISIPG